MKKNLRILVVDDNEAAVSILRHMIEAAGHSVVGTAESPEAAVKAHREHKPDVTTLDLSLIGGDGLAVLKEIRRFDSTARIVVISGNAQKKVIGMLSAEGAAGFLKKPFRYAELVEALEKAAA